MREQFAMRLNFYLSMSLFGLFAFIINALCWLLGLLPCHKRLEPAGKSINHFMMRLWMWHLNTGWCMRIKWNEIRCLRAMRSIVLVSNHPNLLDICWVLAASPNVTCYIKSDIRNNSFYNSCSRLAGYVSNDSGIEGLHVAADCARRGDIVCIFPEGSRTDNPPMNTLKSGFALVALRAGVPIQTLLIRSNTRCFTKGVFFKPGHLPIQYDISLGPLITPHAGENAHSLAIRVENAMRSALADSPIDA